MPSRKKEDKPTLRHIITTFHNMRQKTSQETLQASRMKKVKKLVYTKIRSQSRFGIFKSNTRS